MHLRRQYQFLLLLLIAALLAACTLPERLDVRAAKAVSVNNFAEQLGTALVQHDYAHLQKAMGADFVMASWGSDSRAVPPAVALIELRNHYLSAGSAVVLPSKVEWATLLDGQDPLTLWGSQVQAVKALYVTGLGADQQVDALLIVAQQPDGTPYWSSMLVAPGGFQAKGASVAKHAAVVPNTEATVGKTSAMVTTATASPSAQEETATDSRYLVFAPGATEATVRGVLPAQAEKEYLVRALEGQGLTVALASLTGNATFTISGVADGKALQGSGKGSKLWRGTIPATQDYLIKVMAPAVTPFELVTTFDPRQAPTAAEPTPVRLVFGAGSTTTTTTAQVAAPERQRYLVRGVAGQTLQIELAPTRGAAIFAVQGVTDGKPLKRLESAVNTWSSPLLVTQDYLITVTPTGATVEYTLALTVQ